MKYAATDLKNYKGMVLLNPGGPGGSGITYLNDFGLEFSNASDTIGQIGPNYDLIAFEPRGVGFSIPSANCTNNTSPSAGGVGKRFDQPNGPFLDLASAGGDIGDQLAKVKGEQCQKMIGGPAGAGQHMSTATVARDMVSITDAFAATPDGVKVKNPKLTNYHGTSYGTFLGQTFASMFPERVGRFVLQGVVDPDDQVSGISLTGLQSTDEVCICLFHPPPLDSIADCRRHLRRFLSTVALLVQKHVPMRLVVLQATFSFALREHLPGLTSSRPRQRDGQMPR